MNDNNWYDAGDFTFTNGTSDITTGTYTGTDNITFTHTTGITGFWHQTIPNKDWMPYTYFEYDPIWHKKFARYKIQMETMWDD